MGSVPPTTHANVSTIYLLKNPIKKPTSESDDSKLLIVIDHKKLEIGEFFLEKYLSGDLKKLLAAIKKWDSYLKKFRKSKQLFNSSELPLPVQFSNQESCSPSNSFNSSLTFDSTLVQLFYKNNKLRFIYKINHSPGPPMKYRFICWKTLLNIPNGFSDFGYEKFKRQKLSAEVERDIRKDLHRSYPTQKLFTYREKETNELTLGEKQLYNVLKAISNNYPRIGYCQGMNFIVGYLLLISGGNEHEAFSLFQKMGIDLRFHILGLFESNFPLVNLYVFIFWKMLKETNEDLKIHLEKLGVPDHAWISKWFMMLFLYSLPLDVICRVWDFMFSEESLLALIKISLALMKILKPDLLKFDEIFEIMEYFKILKGGLYEPYQSVFLEENAGKSQKINLKGDILVRKARKIKLTRKMIGETAREFIKLNPKFEKHVILEYYTRFDLIEFKEIKIMECKIRDYFQQEDEKVDKINYRLSFENLPILSENDEFLGVNKMKKIPVFDINNLVIFKKNKKPNKENQSDDEEEESNSEEEFSTAKAIKCSDKMNFV